MNAIDVMDLVETLAQSHGISRALAKQALSTVTTETAFSDLWPGDAGTLASQEDDNHEGRVGNFTSGIGSRRFGRREKRDC